MKVRAKEAGFFANSYRARGEVFEVPDGAAASWFEVLPDTAKLGKAPVPPPPEEPATLSAMKRAGRIT